MRKLPLPPPPGIRPAVALHVALAAGLLAGQAAGQVCFSPSADPMAGRVLRSLAYGPTPAQLNDLVANGINQWMLEQLQPDQIDETGNTQLNAVLAQISLPAGQGDDQSSLEDVVNHVIARCAFSEKQLQERMAQFWDNHFSTFVFDVAAKAEGNLGSAVWFEYLENEAFRDLALDRFEDLLVASATSPAMLWYLDNDTNTKLGPNENYAREVLELHTLGLEGDYTEQDVADLAKVFTGWTVAMVDPLDYGNPAATPITQQAYIAAHYAGEVDNDGVVDSEDEAAILEHYGVQGGAGNYQLRFDIWDSQTMSSGQDGVIDAADLAVATGNLGNRYWVHTFVFSVDDHDYTPKTLFGANPNIPDLVLPTYTYPDPNAIQEGFLALEHIAGLTQCAEFVCTKLYNYFVRDEFQSAIDPTLMASLVTAWGNTNGKIGGVLRVLFQKTVGDSTFAMDFDKVRDGLELSLAMVRAYGGSTPLGASAADPVDRLRAWMNERLNYPLMQHGAPDGFAEYGGEIVDTGKILALTQLQQDTWNAANPSYDPPLPGFTYDFDGWMTAAGVDLDDPAEVTCHLLRYLLQGNHTPLDWTLVNDFLTTKEGGGAFVLDYAGNPGGWNRQVAKTAAFAASLPQVLEQ